MMKIQNALLVLCLILFNDLYGEYDDPMRTEFIWDLKSELQWNWLLVDWRPVGETCIRLAPDNSTSITIPKNIPTCTRVQVYSNTSDASPLATLPSSVTALECDMRNIRNCSFLRALFLKELRIIVPLNSNFDLNLLTHMPLHRLVIANVGKTQNFWEPLTKIPLDALIVTNAAFRDVTIFAKLRVKTLSLVNCFFADDPLPQIAKNVNIEELQIGYSCDLNGKFFNDRMQWMELKDLPLKRLYITSPSIDVCRDMNTLKDLYWLATTNKADCLPLKNKIFCSLTIANLMVAKQQCFQYNIKASNMSVDTELEMEKIRRQYNRMH